MRHSGIAHATGATEDAASVVALKSHCAVVSSRFWLPRSALKSAPAPISAFHRVCSSAAWAMSHPVGDTSSPSPAGFTPLAPSPSLSAPVSHPLSGAHQFVQRVKFVASGTKGERIKLSLAQSLISQRVIAHLGQAAADFDAELFPPGISWRSPCRYAHRVSRAEERPPPQ